MFSVVNNNIILTRGDTLLLKVDIFRNDQEYIPSERDSIRFAMKRNITDPDEDVVLVKSIPTDTLILELEPQDTKSLPMKTRYVYDIELTNGAGQVDTFMKGYITIDEEVY